ncbi:MAG: DUF3000 domain-containing protein [Propionibacteriaceae bacterium]
MTVSSPFKQLPATFAHALHACDAMRWRPEVTIEKIPAPQKIAPFALAIAADVDIAGDEVGNGRFILLHDPDSNPSWGGEFRCVTYVKADIDPSMVTDPLLTEVGWSWFTDALSQHDLSWKAAAGTVTAVSSQSFGDKDEEPPHAEVEIRASWTPILADGVEIKDHLAAWEELLCMAAGIPPLPADVALLAVARRRH